MGIKPKIVVLYHFYYPDEVVSARVFQDLCEELVQRGWDVEVWPCNRPYRKNGSSLKINEERSGVFIRRIWRPDFDQAASVGRVLNTLWMLMAWSLRIMRTRDKPDAILLGTDPPATVFLTSLIRMTWHKVKIAFWCFDLVFECAIVEGILKRDGFLTRAIHGIYQCSYQKIDLIVDLGSCMKKVLDKYNLMYTVQKTLTPWALYEPFSYSLPPMEGEKAFSKEVPLSILYSGNFGVAHTYENILKLARLMKEDPVIFSIGISGNRAKEFKAAITPDDHNIVIIPFGKEHELKDRLSKAHIHLASLKEEMTGYVVPSKFFGSLAVGRPSIFVGSNESSLAQWIDQYQLGWVLNQESLLAVRDELRQLISDPKLLEPYYQRCFEVYYQEFSKKRMMDDWDRQLREMIS